MLSPDGEIDITGRQRWHDAAPCRREVIMTISDIPFPMRGIVPIALISVASFGSNGNKSSADHEGSCAYDDP